MRASTRRSSATSLLARTLLLGAGLACLTATAIADTLERDFADPPSSARPRAVASSSNFRRRPGESVTVVG